MLRFTQEILLALRSIANEEESHEMSKKAREQFDFLGVKLVPRREVTYPIFEKFPPKDDVELVNRVEDMWSQPYREIQYAACDYLFKHKKMLGGQHLNFLKKLIKTRAWKDTVDTIASCILGDLALRLPALHTKIASWIRDPTIWVRRSAIFFQVQYKDRTDWPLLRQFCLTCAKDDEYYIRNGIGKALSEYARAGFQARGVRIRESALGVPTPIIPLYTHDLETTLRVEKALFDRGVYVNPVLPPAVHPSECMLRTSYMATHTEALLDEALGIIKEVFTEYGI